VTTDGDRSGGVRLSVRGGGKDDKKEAVREEGEKQEDGKEIKEKEVRGLGLSFKDPFSSTPGFDSGFGYSSFSAPASWMRRRVVDSPSSPALPTLISTSADTKGKQQDDDTAEEMSKRDSLSPTSAPTPTSVSPTTTSTPVAPRKHISKLPHLSNLSSPRSTLPPSLSTTHPYTGNTHITPSCTSGSLTH
jgi:hypothetical protein